MTRLNNFKLIWGYPDNTFYKQHAKDKDILISEMRPSLLGARILTRRFKNATLVSDNMLGFLFFKKSIKEVVIFYQDRDSFGYYLMPGSLTVVILAKQHNIPIRLFKTEPTLKLKSADNSSLTFLGKSVTATGVLPVLPEMEFVEYKFLEANLDAGS